jgi:hypothetical protein
MTATNVYYILNCVAWWSLIIGVAASLGWLNVQSFRLGRWLSTARNSELAGDSYIIHAEDVMWARFFGFVLSFLVPPIGAFATIKLPLFIFTYAFPLGGPEAS